MTFSIATTAFRAGDRATAKAYVLPDNMSIAASTTLACATAGAQINTMRTATPMLCKGPDGALAWYRLDAERSTPTNPVLIPL